MCLTENEAPISAIPFPTVTICPETKTYAKKLNITETIYSLIESGGNLSDTK